MSRKYGLLSDRQFRVLQLRVEKGLSQLEIAGELGTTRENVTIIEKKARRNIKQAERPFKHIDFSFHWRISRLKPVRTL